MSGTVQKSCPWPGTDPLYVAYHDEEWGVPERDDLALYEKLMLDGFQAGLSWITILRKREAFRRAFDDFTPEKIARYDTKKVEALMQDAGIVRNRTKIEGTIASAQVWLDMMDRGPNPFGAAYRFLFQVVDDGLPCCALSDDITRFECDLIYQVGHDTYGMPSLFTKYRPGAKDKPGIFLDQLYCSFERRIIFCRRHDSNHTQLKSSVSVALYEFK